MDLHRSWDGVITFSSNVTRLRNEATALRNRQEFQRGQLTELANTDFESWAKESFEIGTKIAYRNGQKIGIPKTGAMALHDGRSLHESPEGEPPRGPRGSLACRGSARAAPSAGLEALRPRDGSAAATHGGSSPTRPLRPRAC
jgi:hypothetical protein